jgi:hypothetical protein
MSDLTGIAAKWIRADGTPKQADRHERLDAAENILFLRQLTAIESRWFEVKHAPKDGRKFVPTYSGGGIGPETESYLYRMTNSLGKAKKIISSTDDVPLVNVKGDETSQRFQEYGLGFEYSLNELQAAARVNRPLEVDRANQVRKGFDQQIDDIIAAGDASASLNGFALLSGTDTMTLKTKAAGGTKWLDATTGKANATADEIIFDMTSMISQVAVNTHNAERPTRILMGTVPYEYITNTPRSSISDTTIKSFFLTTHPGFEIFCWERLNDLPGYPNRVIAYDPNPDNVCLLMSIEIQMMPPEARNFGWYVPARMKTGGVISKYPKSIIFADGVTA